MALGQDVAAAQALVGADQLANGSGRVVQGLGFAGHHVGVEVRRAPHGLAGVVDDEVEAIARAQQFVAEGFHAGRVAQVQAEDLETVAPFAEVRLLGITRGRVTRKARGDDQVRARAQQLEPGLVADLDASAGEQGDAPAQVGQFGALAEVELGAGRAQLVVEVVDELVLLLADVAMLWLRARLLMAAGAVFQWADVLCRKAERREETRAS